jgi:hypothetical protein
MTMNESLMLVWRARRAWCSARLLSAACGGRCARAFRPTAGALVFRQHAAADGHCPGGILFVGGGHWQRLLACVCLGFVIARLFVMRLTRAPVTPPTHTARRPAMRLSPDEIIFWQSGFFKLNATIVFTWG